MDIYRYPGHSLATARLTAIEGISPASIAVPEALDIGITGQGDSKTWTEMLELRVQRVKRRLIVNVFSSRSVTFTRPERVMLQS